MENNRANVRKDYGSENLDRIFRYFMRTVLRMEKRGLLALPVENDLQGEPLRSYLDLAMTLFVDAQPQQVVRPILESQYDFIVTNSGLPAGKAMEMWLIRELSLHIHFDPDPYDFLLRTSNLWGDLAEQFACLTFYPNLPADVQRLYGLDQAVEHIPAEMLRLEDY